MSNKHIVIQLSDHTLNTLRREHGVLAIDLTKEQMAVLTRGDNVFVRPTIHDFTDDGLILLHQNPGVPMTIHLLPAIEVYATDLSAD